MPQTERKLYLIKELLKEQPKYAGMEIPKDEKEQKRLLRSLFNIRMPQPTSKEILVVQEAYLQKETKRKGITDLATLQAVQKRVSISDKAILPPCAATLL